MYLTILICHFCVLNFNQMNKLCRFLVKKYNTNHNVIVSHNKLNNKHVYHFRSWSSKRLPHPRQQSFSSTRQSFSTQFHLGLKIIRSSWQCLSDVIQTILQYTAKPLILAFGARKGRWCPESSLGGGCSTWNTGRAEGPVVQGRYTVVALLFHVYIEWLLYSNVWKRPDDVLTRHFARISALQRAKTEFTVH